MWSLDVCYLNLHRPSRRHWTRLSSADGIVLRPDDLILLLSSETWPDRAGHQLMAHLISYSVTHPQGSF